MKTILLASALLICGLTAYSADAMPIAPLKAPSDVTRVDYACGRGWHLNDWGECRPNRWHRRPPPYWGDRPPPRYGWGWDGPRSERREWRREYYRD